MEEERNDEIRMTNAEISPNVRMTKYYSCFVIPLSFDIRASSFL
jgi:hypothetical protein